jgi:hypothetical protein
MNKITYTKINLNGVMGGFFEGSSSIGGEGRGVKGVKPEGGSRTGGGEGA